MHQSIYAKHTCSEREPIFEIRDLCYRYKDGRRALDGIGLTIYAGDRMALAGHNGAGKTTFIKHLNGIYAPEKGEVRYKGGPLSAGEALRRARLQIGILFQDPDDQLFCNTLYEDIAFGPCNQGHSTLETDRIVRRASLQVGLDDLLHKPAHRLSYGQKKRAALATLLSMQPEVLILDEPTANLDSKQEHLFWDLLQDFPGTLLVISHDLEFLYGLCERAVVFESGRIHHDFTMRELVSQPELMRSHGLDFNFRFHCCQDGNGHEHAHEGHHHHHPHTHGHAHPHPRPANETRALDVLTAQNGSVLSLQDYSYTYPDGTTGLRDVSIGIRDGENIAIVGENGAGKSTLAHCLMGVLSGEGTLLFKGTPPRPGPKSDLWRKVGMVFQNPADQLFCPSCEEEAAFGPTQLGLPRSEIRERVAEALSLVRLDGMEKRVPLHLSAGERKRLAIASALSMRPEVLILDEPTAHLDPRNEELLIEILQGLQITKILISHDVPLIRTLCRRVAVLHKGRIVRDYGIEEFVSDHHLISLNGLDYTYRNACHEQILALQRANAEAKPA
ncbi:MAG: ATP-binding cassette domain-containing protein [Desulfobacteraceae bacterium]|nr:ATP-binding cassette domain-containing protein [Desulfobacteraceae bacterium]